MSEIETNELINSQDKGQKKKRKLLWLLLTLLLLFLIVGGTAVYLLNHQPSVVKKANVLSGDFLPREKDAVKMTDSQIASYAQSTVDKSKFQMIINPDISVKASNQSSNIYIENPKTNGYPIAVTIKLTSGITVYSSGAIAVGYEVKNAKLDKILKTGSYDGIATFKLYDAKTSRAKGQVSTTVKIVVQN